MDIIRISNSCSDIYEMLMEEFFTSRDRNEIIDHLDEIFQEYFKVGRNFYDFIENVMYDNFIYDISKYKTKLQNNLIDNFKLHFDILIKKYESDPEDLERYINYFNEEIDTKINYDTLSEINSQFISDLTRKTVSRFEDLPDDMEEMIRYDLMYDVKRYLEKYFDQFIDKFNQKLHDANFDIKRKVRSNLEELDEENKNKEKSKIFDEETINSLNQYAILFGYNISNENGNYVMTHIKTGKKYVVKESKNGLYDRFSNNKIYGIIFDDNNLYFHSPVGNRKITIGSESIKFEHGKMFCEIKINNNEAIILYNGKPLITSKEKMIIIDEINKYYPELCESFRINDIFSKTKKEYDDAKIYEFEEENFKVKNLNEFKKRMFIAGYNVVEENGVYYAVDVKTGIKEKIVKQASNFGFSLENHPDDFISFDFAFISDNIQFMSRIKNGADSILVNDNFNVFLLSSNKVKCNIIIKNDKVLYESENFNNEEEIKKFVSEHFPNIFKYVNSNTKWDSFIVEDTLIDTKSDSSKKFKPVENKSEEEMKKEVSKEEYYLAKIAELEKEKEFYKNKYELLESTLSKNSSNISL